MKIFGYNITKQTDKPRRTYKNRGQYNIVQGWGQSQIAPSSAEFRTEDQILDPSKRARLLDLTRNLVRNSSLFNTVLGQLTTNVVSSCGGKVILNFRDEQINKNLKKYFSDFTRNADFFNCSTFNHLLKRILREYVIGGGCVLVFDDGLIEDSGKILLFESEEIVQTSPEAIHKHYGKDAYQVQGKVYNANGRHIGTVVSRSSRGIIQANPDQCFFLKKDPNGNPIDNNWIHYESNWREGRGISQAASAIATIHQLEDLVSSELMAARRNSQIFCWLTQEKTSEEEVPSAFDSSTDFDNMTDEQIEQAVKEETDTTKVVSFNHARENSVVYEALPEGIDAKQLQTQHPNSNVETMVDWLANRCAATLGLSRVYATGNPDATNWRANQLFTAPVIIELQKELEQVCDWAFRCNLIWNMKHNKGIALDEDFMEFVSWEWKTIDDFDEVQHQTAIEMSLRNCTKTLRECIGSNWKDVLSQIKDEMEYCKQNNIPHPAINLKSGGMRTDVIEEIKQ